MENARECWFDARRKTAVTVVDVTAAAQALASSHLAGPVSARFLAEGLAAAALFGAETSEPDEVVSIQMKCEGPLGGYNVECTADGRLRGYTEKKVLEDFDGLGPGDPRQIVGKAAYQVTRSVPGRILAQGVAATLEAYLAGSLQRKATLQLEAAVSDEVEVKFARGILVEELPDAEPTGALGVKLRTLAVSSRKLLGGLGLAAAELKRTDALAFGCRCSRERAAAMLGALGEEELQALPRPAVVTCHMCGRTFSV